MFLFQTSASAKGSGTTVAGKTLSAQEFSKKVDQLYVRTEVSFREVQRGLAGLDFGDRLLNKNWLEILAMGTPAGAVPTKKEMDLYASAGEYQAAFKDFQKKYNVLKDAIRSKDESKVQPALAELSKSYFELAVSQAMLVQKLEAYDLKGFEYVMPVLEKAMDVGMVVGIATGVGAVASLGRAALAATLKEFLASATKKAFVSAFAGAAFFTALNFGNEYYSFGQLSGAMKRMNADQAGALDELAGILKGMKKKAGDDGEQLNTLIANVDIARMTIRQKLKSDPSYQLDAGRVAAYFGETFAQLVVFEMGSGFFRAAAASGAAAPIRAGGSNRAAGKAAVPKAKAPEAAPKPAQKMQKLSREEMGEVWGKGPQESQFDSPAETYRAIADKDMPHEIGRIIMGEGLQDIKVPAGESKEFALLLRDYNDRYPDVADRDMAPDHSLWGIKKSYEMWAGKEGGSIVDFLRMLDATKLPHELGCRASEMQLLLVREFGAGIKVGLKAIRFQGTARVFEITASDGRRFIAKVDDKLHPGVVAREAFGHNVLRLLGTDPGYKIAVHGDLAVMELVEGMTLFKFKMAGGLPGAIAYSEIAPGATGQARTNYLSSMARIMARKIATWTDDSHAGNFMVSFDGNAIMIDIGDFSTKLGESLSALDKYMDKTIGDLTPAEMKLMHDAFVSEWVGMRENFLKPGNAAKIKAEYMEYWKGMPETGKQCFETLEFYLTRMVPEQAWSLFLNGPPKVSK